jgi:hypothetical protein
MSRLEKSAYPLCVLAAALVFVPDAYAWPAFWIALALFVAANRLAGSWRERERRDEHQLVGDAAIDWLVVRAVSELQKRPGRQALLRSSATERLDDDHSTETLA